MSAFGLKSSDLEYISSVIKKYPKVDSAIIFGSRAMGNYKVGSDIDIALTGNLLTDDVVWDVAIELNENSPLPYKFDVLAYPCLGNKALTEHIDSYGKVLYSKAL